MYLGRSWLSGETNVTLMAAHVAIQLLPQVFVPHMSAPWRISWSLDPAARYHTSQQGTQ